MMITMWIISERSRNDVRKYDDIHKIKGQCTFKLVNLINAFQPFMVYFCEPIHWSFPLREV